MRGAKETKDIRNAGIDVTDGANGPFSLHVGLCEFCDAHGITFISDEIYHHISYGTPEASALSYSDKAIVINSFSKYYSMTGWRLGWMVAPPSFVPALNRLSQNFYLNAPTLSQFAAVEAFECRSELDKHVAKYAVNRAILLQVMCAIYAMV